MLYRPKNEAVECQHLHKSRNGVYYDGPVELGFVCTNPNVTKGFAQAKFQSLDICCVCDCHEK